MGYTDAEREAFDLFDAFEHDFTDDQRLAVSDVFEAMAKAYPEKCHHRGGYSDLWLCSIAAIKEGHNPWL